MLHSHSLKKHLEINKVILKIREKYYWSQYFEDVKNYITTCDLCQRRGKSLKKGKFKPIPIGEPFKMIGIDFVKPLPRTKRRNKYIIVAIDYLTKWSEAKAVRKANAKTTAEFIYSEIICRHGCSQKILSDNKTHFRNELIQQFTE